MAGNLNSGMCSPLCSDVCAFYLPRGLTLSKDLQTRIKELTTSQPQPVASSSISVQASLSPVSTIADIPSSITKRDHLRLTFPTFGKPTDDTDPLNYLTRMSRFSGIASFSRGRSFSYIPHSPVWNCSRLVGSCTYIRIHLD